MNTIKVMFLEDIKESVKNFKMLLALGICFFIILTVYSTSFIQVFYLIFFKPSATIPFPISITYYLLFICIPIITLLIGYDSVSSEIENFQIRGIISKVSRIDFILSKFLSVSFIVSALSFALLLLSSLFTYSKLGRIDLFHPSIFFFYLLMYIAANTSVVIFFSTLHSKSIASLLITVFFYMFMTYLEWFKSIPLTFFHYMNNIVTGEKLILALIVFISYIAVFISLSLAVFGARDL